MINQFNKCSLVDNTVREQNIVYRIRQVTFWPTLQPILKMTST